MIHVDLLYVRWDPIRGGSFIELPDYLKRVPRSVINVKNVDNMCLVYSILAILYPKDGSNYRCNPAAYVGHFSELNLEGFDFNSKITVQSARADIKRMESNHEHFSICCYIMDEDEKSINCFHISDRDERDPGMIPINLLLIEKDFYIVSVKMHFHNWLFQQKLKSHRKEINERKFLEKKHTKRF